MKAIERIIDKAHLDRKRVILSEAEDPRVLKAARLQINSSLTSRWSVMKRRLSKRRS